MSTKDYVPVPDSLLKKLQEIYPPKEPDLRDSEREIFLYAGKRHVVKMLEKWKEWGDEDGALA